MKIAFNEWSIGGKMIFIATIAAILSLFMKWVDIGIMSFSGFQQQGYLILILYIYPVYKLLKGESMSKGIGLGCGITAIIIGIVFLFSKTVDMFGESINFATTGLYINIVASILLTVGIAKYE